MYADERVPMGLLTPLLAAVAIRMLWWAVLFALGMLVLVLIVGTLYHRKGRW